LKDRHLLGWSQNEVFYGPGASVIAGVLLARCAPGKSAPGPSKTQLRIPVNVTADSGRVTDIPVSVTDGANNL
jgi:hypothetical protein